MEEGARGAHKISRDIAGRAPVQAPANSVTLKARARQGNARQVKATSLVATDQPPIAASNITVAAARRHQHHPCHPTCDCLLSANSILCSALATTNHLLRSNLRIVAATHHNIPTTRAHSRPHHHEQQLHTNAALGPELHNPKCWRTCSRP